MRFSYTLITSLCLVVLTDTTWAQSANSEPYVPQGKLYLPQRGLTPSQLTPIGTLDENVLARLGSHNVVIAKAPGLNDFVSKQIELDPQELQFSPALFVPKAFSNTEIFKPADAHAIPQVSAATSSPASPTFIETPESVACLYALNNPRQNASCVPTPVNPLPPPIGGRADRTLAIVTPYDAPKIFDDLNVFSKIFFGAPAAHFQKLFADGNQPAYDKQWELETSVDVEWTFAMAPSASIVLVEAASDNVGDMKLAVEVAASYVASHGGGEVVMSWTLANITDSDIADFEEIFSKARSPGGVVFLAASGDTPGVNYPSTSSNVIAVGGTTINRDRNGVFLGEAPWVSGGAGSAPSGTRPKFQNSVQNKVKDQRGVVDISAVSDAKVGGVYFFDSNNDLSNAHWAGAGGTSVATAIVGGIIHNAGRFASSSSDQLTLIYQSIAPNGTINSSNFTDIDTANSKSLAHGCGVNGTQFLADVGWDFCTGVGTPNGRGGF